MAGSQVERVRRTISAVLPRDAMVDVRQRPRNPDSFDASVRIGRLTHRAVVGWAGEGWPADVEQLLSRVGKLDVVAAHDLSIGARDRLDEGGIGWVDETGRASLALPSGLVVVRDARDAPRPRPAAGWSRSSIAVAEAILSGVEPRVDAVQEATAFSRGATANALSMLERGGFLDRTVRHGPGSARRVSDGDALLDDYADAVAAFHAKSGPLRLHRLWDDPVDALVDELAPRLDGLGASWAATGAAAGALMAPYLSTVAVVELYVDDDTLARRAQLADALGARVVERGHRLEVRPLPNQITATAGPLIDGVCCAPPARVYADLRAKGGRPAEAAQHLREVLHVGSAA